MNLFRVKVLLCLRCKERFLQTTKSKNCRGYEFIQMPSLVLDYMLHYSRTKSNTVPPYPRQINIALRRKRL
jgi:hypothetical protein